MHQQLCSLPDVEKLPGLGKYDSEGEEGEIEEKKIEIERERRKEYAREEEGYKKEYQREENRAGSRERRETSKERDRKGRSRSREKKRSGDRGRERDREGRDSEEGRKNSLRYLRGNNSEGRENSFRSEMDNKDRENRDRYKRDDMSEAREGKARPSEDPGELGGGQEVLSLSIEESNKLRAKLGLRPLNISNIVVKEDDSDMPGELIPGDKDKTRQEVQTKEKQDVSPKDKEKEEASTKEKETSKEKELSTLEKKEGLTKSAKKFNPSKNKENEEETDFKKTGNIVYQIAKSTPAWPVRIDGLDSKNR